MIIMIQNGNAINISMHFVLDRLSFSDSSLIQIRFCRVAIGHVLAKFV